MKKTIVTCDICKESECTKENVQIPCTFTTDQTEGTSVEPYLALTAMDICETCYQRVVSEQPVWANGAQGENYFCFVDDNVDNHPELENK